MGEHDWWAKVVTPFFCSSTKLAELSNPETPNIEAEKPKKIAVKMLPFLETGKDQLSKKIPIPLFIKKKIINPLNNTNDDK